MSIVSSDKINDLHFCTRVVIVVRPTINIMSEVGMIAIAVRAVWADAYVMVFQITSA